jgi:hypothetical protein
MFRNRILEPIAVIAMVCILFFMPGCRPPNDEANDVVYAVGYTSKRSNLSLGDAKYGFGDAIYVSGDDTYVAGAAVSMSSHVALPCYWKNKVRIDLSVVDATRAGRAISIFVTSK